MMKELPDLKQLADADKDELIKIIQSLWDELQKMREKKPKKTSKNSSLPPAKGFKAAVKDRSGPSEVKRTASIGRVGGGRKLSETPDAWVRTTVKSCKSCGVDLSGTLPQLMERYDKIDLPPIRPVVTRVERYGCQCPACGEVQIAPVVAGFAPGSPYRDSVVAVATTLRYEHAISYERLRRVMSEIFNLSISEGALANLFQSVKRRLEPSIAAIVQRLRRSRWVGSDETGARVNGKTQWEWVFQNDQVCLHVIRPSRGADVIAAVMNGHRPKIWLSDLFSAQKKHPAEHWQVCLAHQLRDCQYGMDAGDDIFSPRMKKLVLQACALHRRWDKLSTATQTQYRQDIDRRLTRLLTLSPTQTDGIRLQKRYFNIRDNLFLFLEDPTIPPTNNASEQAIRMSTIFRKVTNGFRSEWGKDLFADIRSIVNTGKRQGLSAFQAISAVLNPLESPFSLS
jgi:transposase